MNAWKKILGKKRENIENTKIESKRWVNEIKISRRWYLEREIKRTHEEYKKRK
jgi:hypothetical protein